MIVDGVVEVCKNMIETLDALSMDGSSFLSDIGYIQYLMLELVGMFDDFREDWEEREHPRGEGGQFVEKGNSEEGKTKDYKNPEYRSSAFKKAVCEGTPVPSYFEKNAEEFKILPRPFDEIKAYDSNKIINGFSKVALAMHWEGSYGGHPHKESYEGYSKDDYVKRAKELLGMKCSGRIGGYKRTDGSLVRCDRMTGEVAIGHPDMGITTLFKPGWGYAQDGGNDIAYAIDYFERTKRKDERNGVLWKKK